MTAEHTTTTGPTAALAANTPWWRDPLHAIVTGLDAIPTVVWLIALTVQFLAVAVLTVVAARRQNAGKDGNALFAAAITATIAFLIAVLAGSFKGLVAFGRDALGWHDGWEYLVPATLDGVAVACALLTLAAVIKHKPADAAYRVVWIATLASAAINFDHEANGTGGSNVGGAYLGLLSLLGMLLLHIVLGLIGDAGGPRMVRVKPTFGARWITSPGDTAAAWLAWQNYPPPPLRVNATPEQIARYASVRHALAHLDVVRRAMRIKRLAPAGANPAAGWARFNPLLRVRRLDAAMAALRAQTGADLARVTEQAAAEREAAERTGADLRRQLAETTALFEVASTGLDQATDGQRAAEERATTAEAAADRARTEAVAARQTAADRAEQVDRLTGALRDAQQDVGRLTQQLADAGRTADRAAEEARRQLAELAGRHAAELAATVDRMTAERDAAVATARADAVTAMATSARDAATAAAGDAATPDATTPSGGRRGAATPDRSPSRPPWSDVQLRAFKLRDDNPNLMWVEIADAVQTSEGTVRRWFKNRDKHAAITAVPTTPIPNPKPSVASGANGTPVHTR